MTRRPGRSPRPDRDARHALGRAGEAAVAAKYEAEGFVVVACNLATRAGEIDLLVRRGRLLCAVEVKTSRAHPAPERLVGPAELARREAALRAVAPAFGPRRGRILRVDVAAVRWSDAGPPEVVVLHGEPLP